jgi:TIR domain
VRVFLSYARADAEFALHLGADLRAAGVNLWVDQLDIPKGAIWDHEVERALQASSHVLVVLSPAAVNSHNVMDEVSFALEERKTVVPVLFQPCNRPFRLRRLQYVDFTDDYRNGLSALTHALLLGSDSRDSRIATASPPPTEVPKERAQMVHTRPILPDSVRIILGFMVVVIIFLLHYFTQETFYQRSYSYYEYMRTPAEIERSLQSFYQGRTAIISTYLLSIVIMTCIFPTSLVLRRSYPSNNFFRGMTFVGAAMCLYWAGIAALVWAGVLKYERADPIEMVEASIGTIIGAAILSGFYVWFVAIRRT